MAGQRCGLCVQYEEQWRRAVSYVRPSVGHAVINLGASGITEKPFTVLRENRAGDKTTQAWTYG